MYGKIKFCDFARATHNGSRFDAIGAGLTNINVPNLPAPIFFSILIEAGFDPTDIGKEFLFEIITADPEGKPISIRPISGIITVDDIQSLKSYAAFSVQFIIKKEGVFTYTFKINDVKLDENALNVSIKPNIAIEKKPRRKRK